MGVELVRVNWVVLSTAKLARQTFFFWASTLGKMNVNFETRCVSLFESSCLVRVIKIRLYVCSREEKGRNSPWELAFWSCLLRPSLFNPKKTKVNVTWAEFNAIYAPPQARKWARTGVATSNLNFLQTKPSKPQYQLTVLYSFHFLLCMLVKDGYVHSFIHFLTDKSLKTG